MYTTFVVFVSLIASANAMPNGASPDDARTVLAFLASTPIHVRQADDADEDICVVSVAGAPSTLLLLLDLGSVFTEDELGALEEFGALAVPGGTTSQDSAALARRWLTNHPPSAELDLSSSSSSIAPALVLLLVATDCHEQDPDVAIALATRVMNVWYWGGKLLHAPAPRANDGDAYVGGLADYLFFAVQHAVRRHSALTNRSWRVLLCEHMYAHTHFRNPMLRTATPEANAFWSARFDEELQTLREMALLEASSVEQPIELSSHSATTTMELAAILRSIKGIWTSRDSAETTVCDCPENEPLFQILAQLREKDLDLYRELLLACLVDTGLTRSCFSVQRLGECDYYRVGDWAYRLLCETLEETDLASPAIFAAKAVFRHEPARCWSVAYGTDQQRLALRQALRDAILTRTEGRIQGEQATF